MARRIASLLTVAFLTSILLVAGLPASGLGQPPVDLYQPGPDPIAPELPARDQDGQGEKDKNDLDMLEMDLSQLSQVQTKAPLLDMEVSTVARTESTLGKSPAAVFVITNEMIRRSGARCIPEVLRLAPGVNVARIDAVRWAISIRGFNGRYANKLLVQIDGRSVYSPWYGGVLWDVQNVVLEDVERIEVIRGPGGTIWGANAVNGVINILTKSAKETQGGYFESGGGTEELGFDTFRYGGCLGNDFHYRVYGMWYERDGSYVPYEQSEDGGRQAQTGFRADWTATSCDAMTLQGDYYNGYSRNLTLIPGSFPPSFATQALDYQRTAGANILYRWTRTINEESDWSFQMYYDHVRRAALTNALLARSDILDLDFQQRFPIGTRHDVIWGCGYRNTDMAVRGVNFDLAFIPPRRNDNLFSYFAQDQMTLRDELLYLIMGSKFEHNDYTGFEFQPSVRMLWTPTERHSLWAAVSRAVHTPSYAEANLQKINPPSVILPPPPIEIPIFPVINGNPSLGSEDVLAYEAGVRVQATEAFYWDLALFFNRYENLEVLQPGITSGGFTPGGWPAQFYPLTAVNRADGETYGFELAVGYTINEQWKLRGAYSFLVMSLHNLDPGLVSIYQEGESPRNQFNLWLSGDLGSQWHLDLMGRYVDSLPALSVPSYLVADVRLAWQPRENFEVFLVGRNLLDQSHPEYGTGDTVGTLTNSEIQQEVYGGVTWRF